ncbi:MAG: CBS domain-containing protein [archaeon]
MASEESMLGQEARALRVGDLMTSPLISISKEDTVIEAARLMEKESISSVIVKDGEEFSGMITDRDIISRVVSKALDPTKVKVHQVMTSPLITISEEATVDDAANKMRESRVRRLVVEKNHQKVGIISESDIIRIDPELHFLIREQSKLEARLTPGERRRIVLVGFCEECDNHSTGLMNVNGTWLCEHCRA